MRTAIGLCAAAATLALGGAQASACDHDCRYGYYYVPRAYVYYAPPPIFAYAPPPAYYAPPAYSYYAPSAYDIYTRIDVYQGPRWGHGGYHSVPRRAYGNDAAPPVSAPAHRGNVRGLRGPGYRRW